MTDHAEIHCSESAQCKEAPSSIPTVIYQIPNTDIFYDEVTFQQSPKSESPESVSELRLQQSTEMKPQRLDTLDNSVEYTVVEDDADMESDSEEEEDSSSSDDSSSTDCSSDSSNSLHSKETVAPPPCDSGSVCAACGRGPFRSLKLHLLHCSGIQVKYECSLCKELFLTEDARKKHYMPLHLCRICDQVFSHESLYHHHQCLKKSKARPTLVLFCSEMMPKACNICKSFFTSEKTLLNHINRVHTSVVSTKICIITDSSALANKKVSQSLGGSATTVNVVNQDSNGKLHTSLPATSRPTFGRTSHSALSTSHRHSSQLFMASAASPARLEKEDALGEPTNRSPTRLSAQADTSPTSGPGSPPAPTVLAMFENGSKDVALMKRMNTSWRSKVPYSCKQCGAILRQPSFIITHRYLHRGHRSHRCQCGRAFKHRLHLLRHCVEHAEATSYICVSCGETFFGARLLAEHMKGKSQTKFDHRGHKWKQEVKRKCRMAFTCECGQLFLRPSAYIWHQLQNWPKSRQVH